jgi:hypothetical protein
MLWGGTGALVSALVLVLINNVPDLDMYFLVHRVGRFLWPFGFWLLATSGAEETLQAKVIVAMSITANAVLYGVVGAFVSTFRPRTEHVRPPVVAMLSILGVLCVLVFAWMFVPK